MTEFFYPISDKMRKDFFGGIYFDNPKSKVEIDYIANNLKKINFEENRPFPEEENQVGKGYLTLRVLFENYCSNNKDKIEFINFYNKHRNEKNIYKIFARMWVIIRYKSGNKIIENKQKYKLKDVSDYSVESVFPDGEWDYLSNYNRINSFMCFLDFMSKTNNSDQRSIILDMNLGNRKSLFLIPKIIMMTSFVNNVTKQYEYPFCTFDDTITKFDEIIKTVGDKYVDKKFIYICESLKNSLELYFRDERMYNLSLCAILELLLTHKPDSNRYNIEESISKQFVRKLILIIYENDNHSNTKFLENELKIAYSIRSDITHGNFSNLESNLNKLYNLYEFKINENNLFKYNKKDALNRLNSNLAIYVKIVLFAYLKDAERLNLLKDI